MCPLPVPNKTRKFGMIVWGTLNPSPKAVGLECVSPSPIFHSVFYSIAIPCSLIVAKLICNSCAPYPLSARIREIKKRAPVPRLLPCWAYDIGLGMNKKVQNTGEAMPNIFLRCGLVVFLLLFFSAFFFQILSPAPSPSHGLCCFLNIGLTQTCIAIAVPPSPHMGTLPKHQEDDKEIQN